MSVLSQFGGGAIKQIQRGTSYLPANENFGYVTLSPIVNMGKTEVRFLGYEAFEASVQGGFKIPMIYLALSNTLILHRLDPQIFALIISWEITEYY